MSDKQEPSDQPGRAPEGYWESIEQLISSSMEAAVRVVRSKYPKLDQHDIDDALGEALVSVVRNLSEHDPSRRPLANFVIDLTLKRVATHFKRINKAAERRGAASREEEPLSRETAPQEVVMHRERHIAVYAAVEKLPSELRETIQLRLTMDNPTHERIAARLNVSTKTVSRRIQAALEAMKPRLRAFEPGSHK